MVPKSMLDRVARRFRLLGDSVRLQLLNQLTVNGEQSVQQLVQATGHGQANVSKHLGQLARDGLLARRKEGLNVFYRVDDPTIEALCILVCGTLSREQEDGPEKMASAVS